MLLSSTESQQKPDLYCPNPSSCGGLIFFGGLIPLLLPAAETPTSWSLHSDVLIEAQSYFHDSPACHGTASLSLEEASTA